MGADKVGSKEFAMSEPRVKLRCVNCKSKFDSRYDKLPAVGTYIVGEIYKDFMYCEKCKKRVDVRVVEVK